MEHMLQTSCLPAHAYVQSDTVIRPLAMEFQRRAQFSCWFRPNRVQAR